MSQAERAYSVLQKLTSKKAPTGEDFDSWTLRCIEALTDKVELLEAKLKVQNATRKN